MCFLLVRNNLPGLLVVLLLITDSESCVNEVEDLDSSDNTEIQPFNKGCATQVYG